MNFWKSPAISGYLHQFPEISSDFWKFQFFQLSEERHVTAVWPRNLGLEQLNGKTRLTLFGAKRTTYHLFFDYPMTWGYVRGMLVILGGHQGYVGGGYW